MSRTLTLMRRDPTARFLPWVVLAAFLSWLGFWKAPGDTAIGFISGLAMPLFIFAQPQRRATLFEATLPIDGRDFLRARIFSLLLYVWTPVSIILLGAMLFGHTPNSLNLLRMVAGLFFVSGTIILSQTLFLPRLEIRPIVIGLIWFAATDCTFGMAFLPLRLIWPTIVAIPVLTALWLTTAWPKGPFAFQYPVQTGRALGFIYRRAPCVLADRLFRHAGTALSRVVSVAGLDVSWHGNPLPTHRQRADAALLSPRLPQPIVARSSLAFNAARQPPSPDVLRARSIPPALHPGHPGKPELWHWSP